MSTFDARELAQGWLSVALASGAANDPSALLARTVLIEQFPDGVRLVATDRAVLLTCWVPSIDDDLVPAPGLDEVPMNEAVCRDMDRRATSLFQYALALTADENYERGTIEARLRIGDLRPVDRTDSFAGMAPTYVVLEIPDTERVWLQMVDGRFPSWRKLSDSFKSKRTAAVALNTEVVSRLAKLNSFYPGRPLLWHFGGSDKAAMVELAETTINGLVMPVRWAFEEEIAHLHAEAEAALDQHSKVTAGANPDPPPEPEP